MDINRLERERRSETEMKAKRKIEENMHAKYRVKKEGINLVIED